MLSIFRAPKSVAKPFRRSLLVESLEDRTCPAAPVLNFSVVEYNGMAHIQGTVTDETPELNFVFFSGATNAVAVADASGNFSVASATSTGTISGIAYDMSEGLLSEQVDALFMSQGPTVSFTAVWGANRQVTITGTVTDESPAQTTVVFSGAISATITPEADGSFSFTATADSLGSITAVVTDPFLQTGTDYATLTNTAPTISNFLGTISPGRFYTFTGHVDDEFAAGLTISFGGLPSLAGKTATVDEDGNFSLTIELPLGEDGEAQASVCDCWGTESELATHLVV